MIRWRLGVQQRECLLQRHGEQVIEELEPHLPDLGVQV